MLCGEQEILPVVILLVQRKLVTDHWVHVSPGLVFGGGWGALQLHVPTLDLLCVQQSGSAPFVKAIQSFSLFCCKTLKKGIE